MVEQLQRTNDHVSAAVLDSLQQEKQKNALLEQELQQMKANVIRNNHNHNNSGSSSSNKNDNNNNNNNDSIQSNYASNNVKEPTVLAMLRYSEEPTLPEGVTSPSRLTVTSQGIGTGSTQRLSSPLLSSHSPGEVRKKGASPSAHGNNKIQPAVKPGTTPTKVSTTMGVKEASPIPTPPTSGSASRRTGDVHHHRHIHSHNQPNPTSASTPLRETMAPSSPPPPPPLTPLRDADGQVGTYPSMNEQNAKIMKSGPSPNHSSLPTALHPSPHKGTETATTSKTVAAAGIASTTTTTTTTLNPLDRLSDEKPLSDPLVAGLARIREHLRDIEANAPSLLEQSGLSM